MPLHLNFDAPTLPFQKIPPFDRPGRRAVRLPRRIIVLIGRNGSGKSTLLARIARVAFASSDARAKDPIKSIGSFEPSSIGFMRVIAISYSAFDNFVLPGSIETELKQIASDVERGSGRFVYAGLRDLVAEARADVEAMKGRDLTRKEIEALSTDDRRTSTRLKSLDQLADEFVRLLGQIKRDGNEDLLDLALTPLLVDPSFIDVEGATREALFGEDVRAAFLGWSTGHKIAMHVIASLVAHATRKSMVLFDEPETHLHPPLIAALLNAVRIVLEETNAFAIVATHSPVILQETLARHVRIVTRVDDRFQIDLPPMETFGENVGLLTQGTFRLTSASTDFHHVLDVLIEGCSTIEEVSGCFTPGLSGQALAYVMSGFARKARRS